MPTIVRLTKVPTASPCGDTVVAVTSVGAHEAADIGMPFDDPMRGSENTKVPVKVKQLT